MSDEYESSKMAALVMNTAENVRSLVPATDDVRIELLQKKVRHLERELVYIGRRLEMLLAEHGQAL